MWHVLNQMACEIFHLALETWSWDLNPGGSGTFSSSSPHWLFKAWDTLAAELWARDIHSRQSLADEQKWKLLGWLCSPREEGYGLPVARVLSWAPTLCVLGKYSHLPGLNFLGSKIEVFHSPLWLSWCLYVTVLAEDRDPCHCSSFPIAWMARSYWGAWCG